MNYEEVFKMLDNGVDPNLPIYGFESWSYDAYNPDASGYDFITYRVLDEISDVAMIRLLRAYGAKSTKDVIKEREEKEREERRRKEQAHKQHSNALVNSLLNKRTLPTCD